MKYCKVCGAKLKDYAMFCTECGEKQEIKKDTKELKDKDALVEAVNKAKQGSAEGFEYLFNRFYKDKLFVVNCILHNEQDAEDVMQDAYMKMMRNINELNNPVAFPAWFGKIVNNTAIDLFRKRKNISQKSIVFSELESENDDGEEVALQFEDESTVFQPEIQFTDAERKAIINDMLGCLKEEQRSCIVLRFVEGLSEKQVAEILCCPVGTVKTWVYNAKKALARQAEELKKKGYQFYSIAPLPLLLLLLHKEAEALGAEEVAASMAQAAHSVSATEASAVTATEASAVIATEASAVTESKVFGTLATKLALGIAGCAIIGGVAAVVFSNTNEDKKSQTTTVTELSTEEMTNIVETTTEITTEEAVEEIDAYELYQAYVKDVLVPTYGVIPEYQDNSETASYNGIQFYDIYDYNQDGIPDMYVKVYTNEGKDSDDNSIYNHRIVNSYITCCDVHDLFYTIEDGKVVLKNDSNYEEWIRKWGLVDNSYVMGCTVDEYRRVITEDAVYIINYYNISDAGGTALKISRFEKDHFEWIGIAGTGDGENAGRYIYGCTPEEYKNYMMDWSGSLDVEDYLDGFGIKASFESVTSFEFLQENVLLYQMKNGNHDSIDDNAVYVKTNCEFNNDDSKGESSQDANSNELVTIEYTEHVQASFSNCEYDFTFEMPHINLSGDDIDILNDEIKQMYDETMMHAKDHENAAYEAFNMVWCEWFDSDDMLSMVFCLTTTDSRLVNYVIFNIDINSGCILTKDEVLAKWNMTKSDFDNRVVIAVDVENEPSGGQWWNSQTYEQSNVDAACPYIGKEGKKMACLPAFSDSGYGETFLLIELK